MAELLRLFETKIKPEWIDEYGHMNVAHYITVCDWASYSYWQLMNGGRTIEERDGHEYAILETHVHYQQEVVEGEPVYVTTQMLAHDDKRFIIFHRMYRESDNALSATNEVKGLAFNLNERRIETFLPDVYERMAALQVEHDELERPPEAGAGIVLKKR